jgi:hypothetical protein
VEAANRVVMMDLALFTAEFANGMYRKPIELLAREIHYEPLPQEARTVIIAAWSRGGMQGDGGVDGGRRRRHRRLPWICRRNG